MNIEKIVQDSTGLFVGSTSVQGGRVVIKPSKNKGATIVNLSEGSTKYKEFEDCVKAGMGFNHNNVMNDFTYAFAGDEKFGDVYYRMVDSSLFEDIMSANANSFTTHTVIDILKQMSSSKMYSMSRPFLSSMFETFQLIDDKDSDWEYPVLRFLLEHIDKDFISKLNTKGICEINEVEKKIIKGKPREFIKSSLIEKFYITNKLIYILNQHTVTGNDMFNIRNVYQPRSSGAYDEMFIGALRNTNHLDKLMYTDIKNFFPSINPDNTIKVLNYFFPNTQEDNSLLVDKVFGFNYSDKAVIKKNSYLPLSESYSMFISGLFMCYIHDVATILKGSRLLAFNTFVDDMIIHEDDYCFVEQAAKELKLEFNIAKEKTGLNELLKQFVPRFTNFVSFTEEFRIFVLKEETKNKFLSVESFDETKRKEGLRVDMFDEVNRLLISNDIKGLSDVVSRSKYHNLDMVNNLDVARMIITSFVRNNLSVCSSRIRNFAVKCICNNTCEKFSENSGKQILYLMSPKYYNPSEVRVDRNTKFHCYAYNQEKVEHFKQKFEITFGRKIEKDDIDYLITSKDAGNYLGYSERNLCISVFYNDDIIDFIKSQME